MRPPRERAIPFEEGEFAFHKVHGKICRIIKQIRNHAHMYEVKADWGTAALGIHLRKLTPLEQLAMEASDDV